MAELSHKALAIIIEHLPIQDEGKRQVLEEELAKFSPNEPAKKPEPKPGGNK